MFGEDRKPLWFAGRGGVQALRRLGALTAVVLVGGMLSPHHSSNAAAAGTSGGCVPTAISAGGGHSLVLGSDSSAHAAGANFSGQLGDGATTNRSSLTAMTGLPAGVTATAVSAGLSHSLLVGTDGRAYGTGWNAQGQLGDGTTTNRSSLTAMTGLPAEVTATSVDAGNYHSLVLATDGRAYGTGYNDSGELGDGTTTNRSSLVAMTGLPAGVTATAVSAGRFHSLVLGSDGRAYGTGFNALGELGDGTTTERLSLVAMTGLPAGVAAIAVSAGGWHSLVMGSDGRAYSTGHNNYGQLGDGTTTDRSSLVAMTGPAAGVTATAVSAGFFHSLVLGTDSRAYGTGANGPKAGEGDEEFSRLGDGTTTDRSSLVAMTGLPPGVTATLVSAGGWHSSVMGSDARVYATGRNDYGQLGDGTTTGRSSLVAMGSGACGAEDPDPTTTTTTTTPTTTTTTTTTTTPATTTTTTPAPPPSPDPGQAPESNELPYGKIVLSINRGRDYGMLAWAIDPETGAPPRMRVTVEGVDSREYEWNYQWTDMPAHTGVNDNRSLVFLAQLPSGTRNVCFDALDPQGGGWTNLGCHSHTVK